MQYHNKLLWIANAPPVSKCLEYVQIITDTAWLWELETAYMVLTLCLQGSYFSIKPYYHDLNFDTIVGLFIYLFIYIRDRSFTIGTGGRNEK